MLFCFTGFGSVRGDSTRRGASRTRGERGAGGWWLVIVLCCIASARQVSAEFAPPLEVCGDGVTQTAIGIDVAYNAYIACVVDGQISLRRIGPNSNQQVTIPGGGLGQGDPDFVTDVVGTTYLCFSQLDEAHIDEGREIYLTSNLGGVFGQPINISKSRADDYAPKLVLDYDGKPHMTWSQRLGEQARVMYWNESLPGKTGLPVVPGDFPALYVQRDGTAHVVYVRGNDLYHNSNRGGSFTNERRVTRTPLDPESTPSLGVDPLGNVLVLFESRNSLYYSTSRGDAAGDFPPPRLIDAGGVLEPQMRVRREGQVTIVYSKNGKTNYVLGQSPSLNLPPQPIDEGSQYIESHPSLEIDDLGNLHLCYIAGGKVYYTNNASAPEAEFSANPTKGEAPLTVRFADLSHGDIQFYEWDFGDGGKSGLPNPMYTYLQPGKYTVSLKVIAAGATESLVVKEEYMSVQDPFNSISVPDQRVIPGQTEVWFPVLGSHLEPIQAFQLMGTYDPNYLTLNRFELQFTAVQALTPEFYETNDLTTYFEVGCIFEVFPPINHAFLGPGKNQTLLNLVYDVSSDAPQGGQTEVELVNNRALSRLSNIFTIEGRTKLPVLKGSTVEIIRIEPPFPRFFLRGDTDVNGAVDITDVIKILNYLFLGAEAPRCLDAADVNDKGAVDISAAVALLNYLFLGGFQPAVPFPRAGLDPTPDAYGDCH